VWWWYCREWEIVGVVTGLSPRRDSGVWTLNSEVSSSTSPSSSAHDKSFLSSSAAIDSFIQFDDEMAIADAHMKVSNI